MFITNDLFKFTFNIYATIFTLYTDTEQSAVEQAFTSYTNRLDIGIILINQHVKTSPIHLLLNILQYCTNILLFYAIYIDC